MGSLQSLFYVTMVLAGYIVEILFALVHLVPEGARDANVGMDGPSWNYTSFLNIAFLLLAAVLLWRFLTTGGRAMLAMMGGGPDDMSQHEHGEQDHAGHEQPTNEHHGHGDHG